MTFEKVSILNENRNESSRFMARENTNYPFPFNCTVTLKRPWLLPPGSCLRVNSALCAAAAMLLHPAALPFAVVRVVTIAADATRTPVLFRLASPPADVPAPTHSPHGCPLHSHYVSHFHLLPICVPGPSVQPSAVLVSSSSSSSFSPSSSSFCSPSPPRLILLLSYS